MSMRSWEQEFYPKPADGRVSKINAVKHSLLKWTGLLKKNLEKHEVEIDGHSITDGKRQLVIAAGSCALCAKYMDMYCNGCPLYEHLGHRCDAFGLNNSPYSIWSATGNALPMVRALRAILKEMEK